MALGAVLVAPAALAARRVRRHVAAQRRWRAVDGCGQQSITWFHYTFKHYIFWFNRSEETLEKLYDNYAQLRLHTHSHSGSSKVSSIVRACHTPT